MQRWAEDDNGEGCLTLDEFIHELEDSMHIS